MLLTWLQMLWGRKLAPCDLLRFAVRGFAFCQYSERPALTICKARCQASKIAP